MTHWSARRLADWLARERGIRVSHDSIAALWRRFCLQPHRSEGFKFSTDPALEAKIRDVVGLYLNPPEGAVVVCVDEKSQIQALDRTAPMLPMRPGQIERQTYDYTRHGTTTLFAALEIATGKVIDACKPRHRHTEFLAFLKQVAQACPRVQLHVVCDNYATDQHAKVNAWLARNPRIHLHFTPTSCSWLNLVECFFSIITRQAIRRGIFTSVADLTTAIETYIDDWMSTPNPSPGPRPPTSYSPRSEPRRLKQATLHTTSADVNSSATPFMSSVRGPVSDYIFKDGRVIEERTSYRLVAQDGLWKIDSSTVQSSHPKHGS